MQRRKKKYNKKKEPKQISLVQITFTKTEKKRKRFKKWGRKESSHTALRPTSCR